MKFLALLTRNMNTKIWRTHCPPHFRDHHKRFASSVHCVQILEKRVTMLCTAHVGGVEQKHFGSIGIGNTKDSPNRHCGRCTWSGVWNWRFPEAHRGCVWNTQPVFGMTIMICSRCAKKCLLDDECLQTERSLSFNPEQTRKRKAHVGLQQFVMGV